MANTATHMGVSFHVGDTVEVHYRLLEKEKVSGKAKKEVKEEVRERIQIFQGIVIGIKGRKENISFVVRRIAAGKIGVERIFPLISPWVKKIVVKKETEVRRAKLYYLRNKLGKEAENVGKEKIVKKTAPKATKKAKEPAQKPLDEASAEAK